MPQYHVRHFFRDIMSAVYGLAVHTSLTNSLPLCRSIKTLAYSPILTPKNSHRTLNLAPLSPIFPRFLQINRCSSTVIFTHAMHGIRIRQLREIRLHRLRMILWHPNVSRTEEPLFELFKVAQDEGLRKGLWLDEEEPVPVEGRKLLRRLLVHHQRGADVQQHDLAHPLWKVHAQL